MAQSAKKILLLPAILLLIVFILLAMNQSRTSNLSLVDIIHSDGQRERINNVQELCKQTNFDLLEKGNNQSIDLIYAKKYNLACIGIPKVGSTFLKKFFYVLKFGSRNAHKIFGRMRAEVHAMGGEIVSKLNSHDLNHVITLIPVRNPYTRLYSAYIDKVYLPMSISLGKSVIHEQYMTELRRLETNSSINNAETIRSKLDILRRQSLCTTYITFQDFLNFVLTEPLRGKAMYDHYCPISMLLSKSICKLKHIMVLKQETFADDVEHVLNIINAEADIVKIFHNHLNKDRAESTIASIVETTYRHVRAQKDIGKNSDCWAMSVVAERLWKSFQLQGILTEKSDFPNFRVSEKSLFDPGFLIKIITDEVKQHPISKSEREMQRRKTVLNAWQNISRETINRIQTVYDLDFHMFGYDANPYNT